MSDGKKPSMFAKESLPNTGGWKDRHNAAVKLPRGFESPIVELIQAWTEYAEYHNKQYASSIGNDGVLGDGWERIAKGILILLNGETGRLDCGTLDGYIRDFAKLHGSTEEL